MITSKKKKSSPKKVLPLPKLIRNELRTTCAMRALDDIKSRSKKKLNDQHNHVSRFYHGRPPDFPSQIALLCDGKVAYSQLYEEVEVPVLKKNVKKGSERRLRLKKMLSRDASRDYYSGVDIRSDDLEKKIKLVPC